jgi:hypothetical protein
MEGPVPFVASSSSSVLSSVSSSSLVISSLSSSSLSSSGAASPARLQQRRVPVHARATSWSSFSGGRVSKVSWSELWALRQAAPGTPEHRRWSIGLYARLDVVARKLYAAAFPRTDQAIREQAWTSLWSRWSERAPGMRRLLACDDDIARYVNRSLVNAMCTQLRRRSLRARLQSERAWDVELVVHAGAVESDAHESLERDERLATACRALAFFRDELLPLLAGRRPGRAAEVARLVQERLAIAQGARTFADVVAAESVPGASTRTIENRLRQRYGRALKDVLHVVDEHRAALLRAGHDPAQLRLFALQLFSDRRAPSRRTSTRKRAHSSRS